MELMRRRPPLAEAEREIERRRACASRPGAPVRCVRRVLQSMAADGIAARMHGDGDGVLFKIEDVKV